MDEVGHAVVYGDDQTVMPPTGIGLLLFGRVPAQTMGSGRSLGFDMKVYAAHLEGVPHGNPSSQDAPPG